MKNWWLRFAAFFLGVPAFLAFLTWPMMVFSDERTAAFGTLIWFSVVVLAGLSAMFADDVLGPTVPRPPKLSPELRDGAYRGRD